MKHVILGAMLLLSIAACKESKKEEAKEAEASEASTAAAPATAPRATEFADPKYIDMARKDVDALVSKDIDGYMNSFADNAVYQYNNGDTIVGKKAITEMWKQLYASSLDSLALVNPIYLPVIVNEPQGGIAKGTYLLMWYRMTAKFKTGKTSNQLIHVVAHYDANDKIDRLTEFVDRNGFPKREK